MRDGFGGLAETFLEPEGEDVAEQVTSSQTPAVQVISDEQAVQIAKTALIRVGEHYPWAGPLLEAVSLGANGPAKFATAWGGTVSGNDPTPDPAKHEAYVAHIRTMLSDSCAWLLSLFDAAGARVLVSPGVFCFMVTQHSAVAFDIPQLVPLTRLTPWAEPDEPKH